MTRVLVTGAGGSIGRSVGLGLAALGHELRALDRVPGGEHESSYALGWQVGDCLDPAAVDRAVEGVEAVVHLASDPSEASLPHCLESHVHTTARLLDAMVRHDVRRIVYASSNHAVGLTPRTDALPGDAPPRPDSFYGVAKVAAEGVLSLYADRHGIDAVALRIGSFLAQPESRRGLSTWLSPRDAVALVQAALTVDSPGFRTVWGVSANTDAWWDPAAGAAIGYEPQDDAAGWRDEVPARPDDDAEAAVVGGPMALPAQTRPAFDG